MIRKITFFRVESVKTEFFVCIVLTFTRIDATFAMVKWGLFAFAHHTPKKHATNNSLHKKEMKTTLHSSTKDDIKLFTISGPPD